MSDSNGTVIFRDADYAGGPRRLIALAIDLSVCFTLLAMPILIATKLWVAPEHLNLEDRAKQNRLTYEDMGPPRYYATVVMSVLLPFGYQMATRRTRGGSIGYRIARIRLIDETGGPPSWGRIVKRTLLSLLAFFTLGAIFIPTFRWQKRQALHDRLAGTWMVLARAMPLGRGQVIYKTKLLGTYPLTFSDIEAIDEGEESVGIQESTAASSESARAAADPSS